jgi:sodium transport system permease protein
MVPGLFLMFTSVRSERWLYLVPLLGHDLLVNQVLKGEPVRAVDLGVCIAASVVLGVAVTLRTIGRYERERVLFG